MKKTCSKCNLEKPLTEEFFYKAKNSKDGFNTRCKECIKESRRQYCQNNKEKVKEQKKKHYEKNKDCLNEISRQYWKDKKECLTKYHKNYYKENREQIIERQKEYYEKNKEKLLEYNREYLIQNNENKKAYWKQYRKNNKAVIKARLKSWYEANKEKVSEDGKEYYQQNKIRIKKQIKKYRKNNGELYRQIWHKREARKRKLENNLTLVQWVKIKNKFDNRCAYCGMTEEEHLEELGQQLHQEHFIPLSEGGEYTHNNIIPACRNCNSSKSNKDSFEWYPTYKHYDKKREEFILEYLGYTENIQQLSIL